MITNFIKPTGPEDGLHIPSLLNWGWRDLKDSCVLDPGDWMNALDMMTCIQKGCSLVNQHSGNCVLSIFTWGTPHFLTYNYTHSSLKIAYCPVFVPFWVFLQIRFVRLLLEWNWQFWPLLLTNETPVCCCVITVAARVPMCRPIESAGSVAKIRLWLHSDTRLTLDVLFKLYFNRIVLYVLIRAILKCLPNTNDVIQSYTDKRTPWQKSSALLLRLNSL